ncbi:MAG: hypothetical protein QF755_06120 [Candidatus Peribacteraceae bacterium]|jgi:hypothetical protein|nr:hypothetical protein [Candidatus Peribacteraceae bacterium]|tara:strand:- start:4009 stop:4170 length:162 start_codon:yes stop_codon:yes gene_type:complete
MKTEAKFSIARATLDGIVTGMSEKERSHPVYNTPAKEVQVQINLTSEERDAAK